MSVVNPRWAVVLNLWESVLVISILVCCTKDNGRTAVVPPLYIMHGGRELGKRIRGAGAAEALVHTVVDEANKVFLCTDSDVV